jgi:hypothetical protein
MVRMGFADAHRGVKRGFVESQDVKSAKEGVAAERSHQRAKRPGAACPRV